MRVKETLLQEIQVEHGEDVTQEALEDLLLVAQSVAVAEAAVAEATAAVVAEAAAEVAAEDINT